MVEDFTQVQLKYNQENDGENALNLPHEDQTQEAPTFEGPFFTALDDKGFIEVKGADAESFLQDILTNDMKQVSPEKAAYGLLLTPQGKLLYDFFIVEYAHMYLLECDKDSIGEIIKTLEKYAVNSEVEITDVSSKCHSVAVYGEEVVYTVDEKATPGAMRELPFGLAYVDPRNNKLHLRTISFSPKYSDHFEALGLQSAERYMYEYLRIWTTIPDVRFDLIKAACFPLDYNFDQLNAIDFNKGCFVGQEVTARMKHKANRSKSLYPVTVMGDMPAVHSPILVRGKKVGMFCTALDTIGIAHLLTEHAEWAKTTNTLLSTGTSSLRIV